MIHIDQINIEAREDTNNIMRLVYAENIVKTRGFENVSEAIAGLDKLQFITADRIVDKEVLDRVLKNPNIRYKGLLRPEQALELRLPET